MACGVADGLGPSRFGSLRFHLSLHSRNATLDDITIPTKHSLQRQSISRNQLDRFDALCLATPRVSGSRMDEGRCPNRCRDSPFDAGRMESAFAALPGIARDDARRAAHSQSLKFDAAHRAAVLEIDDDLYAYVFDRVEPSASRVRQDSEEHPLVQSGHQGRRLRPRATTYTSPRLRPAMNRSNDRWQAEDSERPARLGVRRRNLRTRAESRVTGGVLIQRGLPSCVSTTPRYRRMLSSITLRTSKRRTMGLSEGWRSQSDRQTRRRFGHRRSTVDRHLEISRR